MVRLQDMAPWLEVSLSHHSDLLGESLQNYELRDMRTSIHDSRRKGIILWCVEYVRNQEYLPLQSYDTCIEILSRVR